MYLDIYYAINITDIKKPSKEKVFSYLKKLRKDCCQDLFHINMNKLVKDNFLR